jgi:hypothetical protein
MRFAGHAHVAAAAALWLTTMCPLVPPALSPLVMRPAIARNLPESTGATGDQRGTAAALQPIMKMAKVVSSAASNLPADLKTCEQALRNVPENEASFKRLFDEYSEGISYKQQYKDKNAFLVYYTQGFDGPGRPSIEQEDAREALQRAQYGARNEVWLAIADARAELSYLRSCKATSDLDGEVARALHRAQAALDEYLGLAPVDQLEAARKLISCATAPSVWPTSLPTLGVPPASAAEPEPDSLPIANGVIRLPADVAAPSSDASALYVTVRVVPSNNVGMYVSAGKVPPLAAARFAAPQFPYRFELTTSDLTPEFGGVPSEQWAAQDLVVTCRLDTDGIAATRAPEDLVGRGQLAKRSRALPPWEPLEIELQGRGLTGRVLTGGR